MQKQKFNKAQSKAIKHGKGPMLVLAGPGSGKTLVIVHRIMDLIKRQNVSPENILVVTFSRAAAGEMERRFYGLLDDKDICKNDSDPLLTQRNKKHKINRAYNENSVTFGTIHSVFLHILSSFYDINTDRISYDDMLLLTHKMLLEKPNVLSYWQDRYKYILVDEFQDISQVQYETLNLLAGRSANIFVVGDDDQSIYGFRGAEPEIMKKFISDHKRCKKVLLNINYRCNKKIMNKSLALISLNKNRFDKNIKAFNKRRLKNCVRIKKFGSNKEEFEFIAKEILLNTNLYKSEKDIAILFRNHHDYSLLLKIFDDKKIPYRLKHDEENIETDPIKSARDNNDSGVNIMTMHASKGLEFDTVYLPCLNEGIIPSKKAKNKAAIYEERRLLYVAMTRAKNHLLLSYSENINHKRSKPSEFLDNIFFF